MYKYFPRPQTHTHKYLSPAGARAGFMCACTCWHVCFVDDWCSGPSRPEGSVSCFCRWAWNTAGKALPVYGPTRQPVIFPHHWGGLLLPFPTPGDQLPLLSPCYLLPSLLGGRCSRPSRFWRLKSKFCAELCSSRAQKQLVGGGLSAPAETLRHPTYSWTPRQVSPPPLQNSPGPCLSSLGLGGTIINLGDKRRDKDHLLKMVSSIICWREHIPEFPKPGCSATRPPNLPVVPPQKKYNPPHPPDLPGQRLPGLEVARSVCAALSSAFADSPQALSSPTLGGSQDGEDPPPPSGPY